MVETPPANIETLSFEAALKELETIVRQLEDGQKGLDDSIKLYERGARLKQHCEAQLQQAREKIEKITLAADGTVSTEPLDAAAAE